MNGVYHRSKTGGGAWETRKKVPEKFYVHWRDLTFELKLMNFKHTGIFPEQSVNWARMIAKIKEENGMLAQNLDTGFRVLKLDSSNMKEVYYKPEDYEILVAWLAKAKSCNGFYILGA